MSALQNLVRRAVSFTYGLITLLMFIFFAFWDGSLFRKATEKEKNELKLGSCLRTTASNQVFADTYGVSLAQGRLWNLSKHPNGLTHAFYSLSNGVRLHYVANSDFSNTTFPSSYKNVIIFLHGFPDSWAQWRHFVSSPALRSDNVLIAVDLPGYGGSDGLRRYGATDVLEAVTEFVIGMRKLYGVDTEQDTVGVGMKPGVIIVGHDWGCIIGSRLAAEAPQLADRFILSNAPIPAVTVANVERILSSSAKMLTTFAHHPLSSRSLLRKAVFTLSPLFSQLRKSGYAFVFNLPLPLVSRAGSMGNFWFLRICHQVAAGNEHPFDSKQAAEAMASSHGPGVYECISMTEAQESYPASVRNRSASGGFTEKIRYYREGLFNDTWAKSLETLAALYEIDGARRSSSGAGLFEDEPKGSLKAKTTVVWGLLDWAVDQRMALQGIGDYLPRGSQVIVLPRTGHWTPNPGMGREALGKVIEWAAGGEKGDLRQMVAEVYEKARITFER